MEALLPFIAVEKGGALDERVERAKLDEHPSLSVQASFHASQWPSCAGLELFVSASLARLCALLALAHPPGAVGGPRAAAMRLG